MVAEFVGGRAALEGRVNLDVDHDTGCCVMSLIHTEQSIKRLEEKPETHSANRGIHIHRSVHSNAKFSTRPERTNLGLPAKKNLRGCHL